MFVNDLFESSMLDEGINDQYIFKSIFVCGAPGSGKNTVIRTLGLDHIGLKIVDVDETIARLKHIKALDTHDYARGGDVTIRRQNLWVRNFLGLAVATTGRLAERTLIIDRNLRMIGYDSMMLYVDVEKETALKRIHRRPSTATHMADTDRVVDDEYFNVAFEQAKHNIPVFNDYYNDNFVLVTNDDNLVEDNETFKMTMRQARRKIREFLNKPLNSKARATIGR